MLSSEHYDVRGDDDDIAAAESPSPATAEEGRSAGAPGAGSRLKGEGAGGGVASAAAVGTAPAGGGAEGIAPEILIRPPSYGFNDKVLNGSATIKACGTMLRGVTKASVNCFGSFRLGEESK